MRVVGMPVDERPDRATSAIEFAGNWESYLAAKPRKTRHEMPAASCDELQRTTT